MTDAEEFTLSTYQTIKELSITNISKVSLAKNSFDNKLYIIRTLPRDCREIYCALKQLSITTIPTILDVIYNGNTIVIEEYISGSSLSEISSNGIDYNDLISYVTSLLNTIKILHKNNILHRDIKEDNILINSDNSVILIDFAISKFIATDIDYNNNMDTVGSFTYSAPEQFSTSETDECSDIYSLGIVIKNLINKCHNVPESLQNMWMHIINKCTEFLPEKRFQSVEEILNIIDQPAFFYGDSTKHIINFSNPSIPPCVRLHDNDEKTIFQIYNQESVHIFEKNGTLHLKCTNSFSINDYSIFENSNSISDEKTLTEIFFLPKLIIVARAFYYPCHKINYDTIIVNRYNLMLLKLKSDSTFEPSNTYENLTGFTVLGEYETIMDNDTLITINL